MRIVSRYKIRDITSEDGYSRLVYCCRTNSYFLKMNAECQIPTISITNNITLTKNNKYFQIDGDED